MLLKTKKGIPQAKVVQRKSGLKKNEINNATPFMYIKTYAYAYGTIQNTLTWKEQHRTHLNVSYEGGGEIGVRNGHKNE